KNLHTPMIENEFRESHLLSIAEGRTKHTRRKSRSLKMSALYVGATPSVLEGAPTQVMVDRAAAEGDLGMLQLAASLPEPILPTEAGIDLAAGHGHLPILQLAASLPDPILPTEAGIYWAASDGHLPVLQWAASLPNPILPTENNAN